MAVSIIVSNFNGAKYLPRLLESLTRQREVTLEIIVVDRQSTDNSPSILKAHSDVRVVSEPPESGLVAGYVQGVGYATFEHLFFCNEDMWFDLDCLANLERKIDVSRRIWAADPWQWTYDGSRLIHAGTRFEMSEKFIPNIPHPFRRINFVLPLQSGAAVPFGCAGAIMVDRAVYEELCGWDASFFLDKEDLDIFLRAWRLNWKCVAVSEAKVYHAVGASNDKKIRRGTLPVHKRRYISSCSSQLIMSVKYFPIGWVLMHLTTHILWSTFHLATLRYRQSWWDILAIGESVRRLPAAWNFRNKTRRLLSRMPGQRFFTEPAFQWPPAIEGKE